ncbi:lysozyme, partial [Streptomyces sp. NPDC058086]
MRRRIAMSMLAGVILSASTFLGAVPASAAPPADAVRAVGTPARPADQTADTPHDAPSGTPSGTA